MAWHRNLEGGSRQGDCVCMPAHMCTDMLVCKGVEACSVSPRLLTQISYSSLTTILSSLESQSKMPSLHPERQRLALTPVQRRCAVVALCLLLPAGPQGTLVLLGIPFRLNSIWGAPAGGPALLCLLALCSLRISMGLGHCAEVTGQSPLSTELVWPPQAVGERVKTRRGFLSCRVSAGLWPDCRHSYSTHHPPCPRPGSAQCQVQKISSSDPTDHFP